MHPLFLAHLLGDFLFQPSWLVRLKENKIIGVVVHALVHGVTMAAVMVPANSAAWSAIACVVIAHGFLDQTKIHFQKRGLGFASGFIADQLGHLLCLMAVLAIIPNIHDARAVWVTQPGIIFSAILLATSLIIALYNIVYKQKATLPRRDLYTRTAAILLSFSSITLASLLFV